MKSPLLKHKYSAHITSAAELYLVSLFERESEKMDEDEQDRAVSNILVDAAMRIVSEASWVQPSDEQLKAAAFMYQEEYRRANAPQDPPPPPLT